MKWKFWVKDDDRDLQAFYESLSPVRIGLQGYSKADRSADFRRLFNTPEGRRVLAQVIAEAEGAAILESEVGDTHKLAFRAGKRYLGQWIVRQLNAIPLED